MQDQWLALRLGKRRAVSIREHTPRLREGTHSREEELYKLPLLVIIALPFK